MRKFYYLYIEIEFIVPSVTGDIILSNMFDFSISNITMNNIELEELNTIVHDFPLTIPEFVMPVPEGSNIEGIQNFYKNERDCIFFNQAEDLMDKIDTWLNSNKKNEIRKSGYNTAHKKNSYQLKVEEFLTHIEKYNGN